MAPTLDWSHSTVLEAEPMSAARARGFVCLHLVAHQLPHLVEDVRLVVPELATNAVAHAQTPFVVTLSRANGSVLLAIEDQSSAVPIRSAPDVMDMSGRGLMLVELISRSGVSAAMIGCASRCGRRSRVNSLAKRHEGSR